MPATVTAAACALAALGNLTHKGFILFVSHHLGEARYMQTLSMSCDIFTSVLCDRTLLMKMSLYKLECLSLAY
jgi:hypothetical protein